MFCAVSFVALVSYLPVAVGQAVPDLDSLVAAGRRSAEKLRTTAVSWRYQVVKPDGRATLIKRVRHGDRQGVSFTVAVPGQTEVMLRLVEKDGVWHMWAGGVYIKSRPYEVFPPLPGFYSGLEPSELRFITNRTQLSGKPFASKNGRILSFYEPATPPSRALALTLKSTLNRLKSRDLPADKMAEVAKKLETVEEFLNKGDMFQVDETTGLIVAAQMNDYPDAIADFRWVDDAPEAELALPDGVTWEDRTRPWSDAEVQDSVLIRYGPGMDADTAPTHLCLLNLTSGNVRRLPYSEVRRTSGVFSADKRDVLLAADTTGDKLQAVRINLATGKVTPVGGGNRPEAFSCITLESSPSGDKVAAVLFVSQGDEPAGRICVINPADGAFTWVGHAERIGQPINWLPDGDGFVFVRYKAAGYDGGSQPRMVCRMDMNGGVTELFEGDSPVVLRKTRRILYQDKNTRLWHVCGIDGKDSQLFGDGFDDHFDPAVSPDETKIVFMREQFGKPPQPYLFTLGKTSGSRITRIEGVFAEPIWR